MKWSKFCRYFNGALISLAVMATTIVLILNQWELVTMPSYLQSDMLMLLSLFGYFWQTGTIRRIQGKIKNRTGLSDDLLELIDLKESKDKE